MKRRILVVLFLGCLALPAAGTASFGIKVSYFMPSEQVFKDIYGSGPMFGGEFGFSLSDRVGLWADGQYYSGTGKLTYTKEETKLTLVPIGAGVRVDLLTKGAARPYVGAGVRCYIYKETNVIGTAEANGVGFVGLVGVNLRLAKGIILDLRAAYSSCSLTPADFKINVGGIELGGGLAVEF